MFTHKSVHNFVKIMHTPLPPLEVEEDNKVGEKIITLPLPWPVIW